VNLPKNKILVGITIIVILLIITNPSPTAFKEYVGARSTAGLQRKYNFFVFSYYYDGDTYFAIAGNFFLLKNTPSKSETASQDTTPQPLDVKPAVSNIDSINMPDTSNSYKAKKSLYSLMVNDKLYTKTFYEFNQQFSTIEKVSKLCDFLTQKGKYDKGEFAFQKQFFPSVFIKSAYRDRLYLALKDCLTGFTTSKADFDIKLRDTVYAFKVYKALAENYPGFNKTQQQFLSSIAKSK
jgi:hypothetical protein